MGGIGGFAGLFDLKKTGLNDPILVSGTDGVGTKLKIAIEMNQHDTIGIDLVAMCVNDVLVQGALPLFFLDYFATGKLQVNVAQTVIQGIAAGCLESEAALLGGETAEMPDFYPENHYDLAGFCVGAVERDGLLPRLESLKQGDVLLGLPASGFHSNGYSLVRKLVNHAGLDFTDKCPWDETITIGDALLVPTKIYVKAIKPLLESNLLDALCHITGGGLTENLPRILPEHLSFEIDLTDYQLPACFAWAKEIAHLPDDEMLKTFNCGIGMVLVASPEKMLDIMNLCPDAFVIGQVVPRQQDKIIYRGTL